MVATNLKSETMKLIDQRTSIETEMNAIIDTLCRPSGPGISGNLVDSEGFPRTDIDIPVVRAQRHRLAELKNDHKEVKIDKNIQALHLVRLAPKTSSDEDSGNHGVSSIQNSTTNPELVSASTNYVVTGQSLSSMDVDLIVSIPFAVVDEIADGSPTAEDGLQLGDQVIKFGNVEHQPGENLLLRLSSEAQANQGCAVPLVIMRQGAPFKLTVTPRAWQGRGLLGCSFRIL